MTAPQVIQAGEPSASPAPPGAPARPRSPGDPLETLLGHVRTLSRVDAVALIEIDEGRTYLRTAASWYSSPVLREAVEPLLDRPYDRELPGLAETAIELGRPLWLPRIEDWEAAESLLAQIDRHAGPLVTAKAWELFRRSSVIACPVRTGLGRTLGVLIAGAVDPQRALRREELRMLEALADLAALAFERSGLLAAETARARGELMLKRAAEGTAASLELEQVERHTTEHALQIGGADYAQLSRITLGSQRLVNVSSAGQRPPGDLPTTSLAEVARSRSALTVPGPAPSLHVPIVLGPRLFGVLSVRRSAGGDFTEHDRDLMTALARISAAGIANSIDFERERRVSRALTLGFVPQALPAVAGYSVGLRYEPADDQPVGGDIYGVWTLPGGEIAVLVGDVAGKGVEIAGLSAMARFFVEARSWDCTSPAEVLAEVDVMLSDRLPADTLVTAFLGYLTPAGLRYANAGHLAPVLLRRSGALEELSAPGLAIGVQAGAERVEREAVLNPGDLVVGYTDGLIEARRSGELFGVARLHELIIAAARSPGDLDTLAQSVLDGVRSWASGLSDDTVALVVRREAAG